MIPRWLYPIAPLLFAASMAAADPPGRVGRISLIAGTVSLQRAQTGEWEAAALNWPVTGGDAIETWGGARAELRIGSTALRLDGDTELEFVRLDDDAIRVRLVRGSLYARIRSGEIAREFELSTAHDLAWPLAPGRYRFEADSGAISYIAYAGSLGVDSGGSSMTVHAGERAEEARRTIRLDHAHAEVTRERFHDLLGLVQAQQPVVDEHAGELVADRAMDERCRHRRIHAAGKTEDHFLVADLPADALDRLRDMVWHVPVMAAAADLMHEAREDLPALEGVRDLGVKLEAVIAARLVGDARDRRRRIARDDLETRRQAGDAVAVAHPDIEQPVARLVDAILDTREQRRMAARAQLGMAEFAHPRRLDLAAELGRHRLHPIADAQHGHAEREDARRCAWGLVLVY